MKRTFLLVQFSLFLLLITAPVFSRDRRKDFSFGHYYENFNYSFDTPDLSKSDTNYDIESVTVRRKKDLLIVMVVFKQPPIVHADDKITIMIDNQSLNQGRTIFKDRGKKNPASKVSTDSSIEFYAWETISQGIVSGNLTSSSRWIYNPKTGFYHAAQPFIIYNIPTSSIRNNYDNELPTDQLSLIVTISTTDANGNISIKDAVPYSACKISTKEVENDTLELDFSYGITILGQKLIW